jgi:D-ribose pyranose/furanose isomerase RbsD
MPLKKEPIYIAFIEYLRSFVTIENELEYLFLKKDTTSRLFGSIAHNNPTEFFLHIEDSYSTLKESYKFRFKAICDYFKNEHYFSDDNYTIYLDGGKLDNLKILNSAVDNYLIESFVIADKIKNLSPNNQQRRLEELINGISTRDRTVDKLSTISDLHIHLGAGMQIEHRLNFMILNPSKVDTKRNPIELFVKLTGCSIDIETLLLILSLLEQFIIYNEVKKIHRLLQIVYSESFFKIKLLSKEFSKTIRDTEDEKFSNTILQNAKIAFRDKNIIKADRYLMVYLMQQILDNCTLEIKKSAIKIYFVLRNILKTHIVQQHRAIGYGYFSSYSRSSLRRNYLLDEKRDIINSLFRYDGINIEARVTAKTEPKAIANDIKDYILAFQKKKEENPNIGFGYIFHFIKSKDSGCKNDHFCFRFKKNRERLKKMAFTIVDFLSDIQYQRYLSSIDRETNSYNYLNLLKYFKGIDVASKEYYTPPYLYSPIYRFFKRSKALAKFYEPKDAFIFEKEKLTLKYTYHVGEEFRDIVSGIRNIFEAVLFLDLREQDRIGHALALGIEPKNFYRNIKNIFISKEERFDNAIFIYYILDRYGANRFYSQKKHYEGVILKYGREIYRDLGRGINTCCIADFIDAWFLRRNCYLELHTLMQNLNISTANIFELKEEIEKQSNFIFNKNYVTSALPDFFDTLIRRDDFLRRYHTIRNNQRAYDIYNAYMSNPRIRKIGAEMENYHINSNNSELIRYIQDTLIEKLMIKRDITIEVLLSSNILLSHINSLDEHPIFRFKPIDSSKKSINVVLGSDNPIIQNTNIYHEYSYLYHYLKDKHGKRDAKRYIREINVAGNEEFNRGNMI